MTLGANKGVYVVGVFINKFESLPSQTVKDFNDIFVLSPIMGDDSHEVEIGEYVGGLTRKIMVNGEEMFHVFISPSHYSSVLKRRGKK